MMHYETPVVLPGPSERLRRRLAAYSRYASIVQAQFQALEDEDTDRFSELADHRQEIQDELEMEGRESGGLDELNEEGRRLLRGAQSELQEAAVLDAEIRNRLIRLRGKLGGQIKEMNQREGSVKEYLTQEEPSSREKTSRLNVRL